MIDGICDGYDVCRRSVIRHLKAASTALHEAADGHLLEHLPIIGTTHTTGTTAACGCAGSRTANGQSTPC